MTCFYARLYLSEGSDPQKKQTKGVNKHFQAKPAKTSIL